MTEPMTPTDDMVLPQAADDAVAMAAEMAVVVRERDEWKDKAYRLAAEADNAKRRAEAEVDAARKFAVQGLAKDLLPVADNLLRALDTAAGNEAALREGVTMVAAQLEQALARAGVAKVDAVAGQPLNPEVHQAMSQMPSAYPHGHVVSELQGGYTLHGRLLRPAMVVVSSGEGVA